MAFFGSFRKKALLALVALLPLFALAQSVGQLRYDTVVIMKSGGNSNLKILDATRDSTGGVYYNAGGGVLRAKRTRAINDSTFIVGGDTVRLRLGTGGGGGTDNTTAGSGFRPLNNGTQALRSFYGNTTIAIDSSSNANGLTWKVDTTVISTIARLRDTSAVLRSLIGTGGVSEPATQVLYGTGSGVTSEAAYNYTAATNKLVTDTFSGLKLVGNTIRIPYTTADNKFLIQPNAAGLTNSGIYYTETLANGFVNPVISIGIGFAGALNPDSGHVRMGLEGNYLPFVGAPDLWFEAHPIEIKLAKPGGGPIYRPMSWEGTKRYRSGTIAWRANSYNFFDADGLNTGSNADSVLAAINNNGFTLRVAEGADGILMTHRRSNKYVRIDIDSTNHRTNIATDEDALYINAPTVYISNTTFRNFDPTTGSDNSFGGITLRHTSAPSIDFVTGGVWSRARLEFAQHYGNLVLNHPYGTRGHDGANNGIILMFDDRDGVADPLRGFTANTAGAVAQWIGVGNTGKIGFGTPSSTESYLFKSHASSTNPAFRLTNAANTTIWQVLDNGLTTVTAAQKDIDTTTYKVLVVNGSNEISKMYWPSTGGGGGIDSSIYKFDGTLSGVVANFRTISIGDANTIRFVNGFSHFDTLQTYSFMGAIAEVKNDFAIRSSNTNVRLLMGSHGSTTTTTGMYAGGAGGVTQYMQIGSGDNGLALGGTVLSGDIGGSIAFDTRAGVAAPVRFFYKPTGTTTSSVGGVLGDNGNWNFGSSVTSPTAKVSITGGSTSFASLNMASQTAPTSPVDGDMWVASNHLWGRYNGVTYQLDQQAGAPAWGSITGTLSSQTDLNTALGLKAPLASPTFTGTVTTPLIKITSGSPGLGKVLTSDADGDASWTALEEVVTAEVNTSSTSATTLATITPTTGEWGVLDVTLSSVVTTTGDNGTLGSKKILYKVLGNGTLSIQSTTDIVTTYSSNSSTWTVDVSGSDLRVRVTSGVADPTVWNCTITKRNSYSGL